MADHRTVILSPSDTLFFRDGRPYNQDDVGLADARSVFPPFPATVAGAVRAALASGEGWSPAQGSWAEDAKLRPVLGDGPDDLGALTFSAPMLVRRQPQGWERLYPPPATLMGRRDAAAPGGWTDLALLRPGAPVPCDLGDGVRLPALPEDAGPGMKAVRGAWLTAEGLAQVQAGAPPPERCLVAANRLWAQEPRIGLARDNSARTAVDGQLYAATHVRPHRDVALAVTVTGIPDTWEPAPMGPLGGEHRTVWIEAPEKPLPPPPDLQCLTHCGGEILYTVILLSPALPPENWNTPGGAVPTLPGCIVSACIERPVMIGGWRSRYGSEPAGPLPLRPHLPAGSVWFMAAPETEAAGLRASPPAKLDPGDRSGFGDILIGTYPGGGAGALQSKDAA